MSEKKTYTPKEFAALFGRERTWAYRLLHAGKINGITDYGRIMIPASEADRIEGEGTRYLGRKKAPKKQKPAKISQHNLSNTEAVKGSSAWSAWIEKRRRQAPKQKGFGGTAKKQNRDQKKA